MIALATVIGIGAFLVSWLLHVVIWRIHVPKAYPIYLVVIFFVLPVTICCIFTTLTTIRDGVVLYLAALLLHCLLSSAYIFTYAGIGEYSPSIEILLELSANAPQGLQYKDIQIVSLSEYQLTGKRIDNLLSSGTVITDAEGFLHLTSKGRSVIRFCIVYRTALGLTPFSNG
jgi:predicted transcriptional regulator